MDEKVLLILADGLRPDAMMQCGHPFVKELLSKSSYTLEGTSVFPPVTLPAHVSLFHSVTPDRHGTTTNTYMPQVRPIPGLFEQLALYGKKCAFFYSWEELRDIGRPASLACSYLYSGEKNTYKKADMMVTQQAIRDIPAERPDFAFIYLGFTDDIGHRIGWMTPQYMDACRLAFDQIERMFDTFSKNYTIIFTADHGGHQRLHGMDIPEDMLIPITFTGPSFKANAKIPPVNLCDIAPTITDLMGVLKCTQWEGKSLF